MPYIKGSQILEMFDLGGDMIRTPKDPGELNYVLTSHLIDYIGAKGLSYQTINDIVGALEGCKLEFYRRVAVPYEDDKRDQNGDVY